MERMANSRPPWFWWFFTIILSSCFTILAWSLCMSIFNNPEVPRNYEILRKLGRLPEPKPYTSQTAPEHSASTAPEFRKSYLEFSDEELTLVNSSLLNSYLTNFREDTFCTYLKGHYQVISSRKLTQEDIISEGFAVQLRAYTQPDEYTELSPYPVIAEIIFPTTYSESHEGFHPGDMLEFGITPHFASLLHLEKIAMQDDDTIMVLTAVSLASRLRPPHGRPFELTPPKELKLNASFPLFSIEPTTTATAKPADQ